MAPRLAQREYATMIAESPVRHAIFNKPFVTLRRRTENLLDQITGGTLPPHVIEEQRREKERNRALTCRSCRMIFATDSSLAKHYDMFPTHFRVEQRRRKPKPAADALDESSSPLPPPGSPQDVRSTMRNRTHSSPNLLSGREAAVNQARSEIAVMPTAQEALQAPKVIRRDALTHTQSTSEGPYLASDFYMPAPGVSSSGYDLAYDTTPSPYAVANAAVLRSAAAANTETSVPHTSRPLPTIPHVPNALPTFDFEQNFTTMTSDGVMPAPTAHDINDEPIPYDFIGDRNREAGAKATAGASAQAERQKAATKNPRLERPLRRGASDGAILESVSPTFRGIVRAVIATGATGPSGQAVMPEGASPPLREMSPNEAFIPLPDDENVESDAKQSPRRTRTASGSGKNWGALMEGLPGSPSETKRLEQSPFANKQVLPIQTGLTSFSATSDAAVAGEPPASPADEEKPKTRSRRNTNPFLNRDFIRALPNPLKTPPLSPSSPWSNAPASPPRGDGAFQQLQDDDNFETVSPMQSPWTPADMSRRTGSPKEPAQSFARQRSDNQLFASQYMHLT